MKKSIQSLFYIFVSVFVFALLNGCGDEDVINNNNPPISIGGLYIYILSEGSAAGTGKLSLYTTGNDSMYESIFSGPLSFPDGLYYGDGGSILVVEQGATFGGNGKLYKLDGNGTLQRESAPFGSSPYSLTTANDKIYVTNGPGGNVSVLDKNTLNVLTTVPAGVYPQEIFSRDNKVYVCNTSAFGGASDSTITVIDAVSDTIISTITLRKEPTSIFYTNGYVYIGCNPAGMIFKIDPVTLSKTDSFSISTGFSKDISYSASGNSINFIDGANNISQLDYTTGSVTTVITNPDPSNNFFYGYTYIDKHYILDAKNFTTNGKLYVYSAGGVLEKTHTTGVAPRRTISFIVN